jgi:hypothetical protein
MNRRAIPVGLLMACAIAISAAPARADAVTHWNVVAGNAALACGISPGANPLHESRMYAITHLAVHDALNAIDRRSRPYALDVRVQPVASVDAAVAAAARGVLVVLLGQVSAPFNCSGAIAPVEAAYTAALGAIPASVAKDAGLQIGEAAAAAILGLRANDGSDTPLLDFAYPQGTQPGEYRFTPNFNFVFAPGWADVTPFVLHQASQFRPGQPPYAVTSRAYADDYDEVKMLGARIGSTRSADETETALFWVESSPLQWNRIARTVSAARGLDPWENARLFGLLNMALADGYIGSFEAKAHYNFWRPVTAIQNGDADGNPSTLGDPLWEPLVDTPPIPDYDSAHSVEGAAASEVFQRFFGTDDISFTTCSLTLPAGSTCSDPAPVLRSFSSFSQAAEENGRSRILVGFHFRHAVEAGLAHGRQIGKRAAELFLKPVQ